MTNPNNWFLTRQALDHRDTVEALATALPDTIMDGFREVDLEDSKKSVAGDMAIELARAGYALVRLTPAQGERTEDPAPFLSRRQD